MTWQLPNPYVLSIDVEPDAIDHYGHVNNTEYLRYIEQVSWAHSAQLGLTLKDYQALDRAMVVTRHEIDYLAPAYEGETLQLATWIVDCDQKMRLVRRFQLYRPADQKTLMQARTTFICASLSSGRPRRFPAIFIQTYLPAVVDEDAASL